MKSKNTNGYKVRGDIIQVQGSINGEFKRYSTGLKATKSNLTYIKNNHREELERIHLEKNAQCVVSDSFYDYALSCIRFSNKKRKENTAKEYLQILEKRILPPFKDFSLKDISRNDLKTWQQNLVDSGLSGKRVNNIRSVFNFILEEARKDEFIDKNYFSLIDREKEEKVYVDPFSLDEVKLILSNSHGWEKWFIQLAFFTGMRTGEIVALKWEDINFANDTIHIKRGVRKGKLGTTKTEEMRVIDMLPLAKQALMGMKKETYLRNSFVFLAPNGSHHYDGSVVRNGVWTNSLKLSGLDYRTLYTTRHTFASIMVSEGEDIGWVSNMLGHADINITLKRYAKFIKTNKKVRATFLNNFKIEEKNCTKEESVQNISNEKNNNFVMRKIS